MVNTLLQQQQQQQQHQQQQSEPSPSSEYNSRIQSYVNGCVEKNIRSQGQIAQTAGSSDGVNLGHRLNAAYQHHVNNQRHGSSNSSSPDYLENEQHVARTKFHEHVSQRCFDEDVIRYDRVI